MAASILQLTVHFSSKQRVQKKYQLLVSSQGCVQHFLHFLLMFLIIFSFLFFIMASRRSYTRLHLLSLIFCDFAAGIKATYQLINIGLNALILL